MISRHPDLPWLLFQFGARDEAGSFPAQAELGEGIPRKCSQMLPCCSLGGRGSSIQAWVSSLPSPLDSRLVVRARTLCYSPRNPRVWPSTVTPGRHSVVFVELVGPETMFPYIRVVQASACLPHSLSLPGQPPAGNGGAPEGSSVFTLT